MRILIGTNDVPPDPYGLPYQRWTYLLIKGLGERGHRVMFWCIEGEKGQAERARRALAGFPAQLRIHQPVRRRRSWSKKVQTLRQPFAGCIPDALYEGVRRECENGYDVLHLENFQWGSYLGLKMPRALASVHMLNLVDNRGTGFRSWRFFQSKLLFEYAERKTLRQFRHIRVLTEGLAKTVRAINRRAEVYVVPLAIDPAIYHVVDAAAASRVVGFIGTIAVGEINQRAVRRLITSIWPLVRLRVKDAQLLVAGRRAREALAPFLSEPGVMIWENVRDAAEFFQRCAVFAYPLTFGGGLKGKILETMAYGVPLVTTAEGIAGVDAVNGVHAFIEEDDALLADRIVQLLQNPSLRRRMAQAARGLVEERYSPDPVISQVEAVYRKIASA